MSTTSKIFTGLFLAGLLINLHSTAEAARYWDVAGVGAWEGTNWKSAADHSGSAVGQPSVGDTVVIGDNYITGGTVQITQAGEVSRRIWLGYLSGKSGTMEISSGSLTVGWAGDTDGGYLRVGESGTGVVNQSGGDIILGFEAGHTAELQMAYNASAVGTYNLSDGTLTTADIVYGAGTGTINQTGGTITATGGVTNGSGAGTLNVDGGTMTVGNGFDVDSLRVGYDGLTASLTVSGGAVSVGNGSETLDIGRRTTNTSSLTQGTVDFGSAASVNLDLDELRLGTDVTGNTSWSFVPTRGILTLSAAGNNTIDATSILLGYTNSGGHQAASTQSEMHLGGAANTINTDTFTIGGAKSVGLVDIVSGGTLTLGGLSGASTDLYIGDNVNTGTGPAESKLDLSGGTFNATLGQVVIGRHTGGSGSGTGSLTMGAGTVTANSIQLGAGAGNATGTLQLNGGTIDVTGSVTGDGTSTLNVDGGTVTVGGDLDVDTLRVGYLPSGLSAHRTGAVTVTGGGNVEIGSAANPTDLYLGYNMAGNSYNAVGTLDLTGAAQFDAYLGKLSLGEVTVAAAYNGRGQGILKLPALTNIDAEEILVSWSAGYGVNQPTSSIELGTTSNFNVDTFTVGGFRGFALVEFATTGTLTLAGLNSAEADLLIANCNPTNYAANGHMDMSGGTFDATLDQLLIGYDGSGPNNGGSVGKLTFSAGTITANSLTVGDADSDGRGNGTLDMSGGSLTVNGNASLGTGTAVSTGTINLNGGTIDVTGSVVDGAGTGTLNVDDGTMTVGTGFDVDNLRVGYEGGTGTLTVNGGAVAVGTGSNDLFIGFRDTGDDPTLGTVDFGSASSVNLDLNNLHLGTDTTNDESSSNRSVVGILTLSAAGSNTIDAAEILLGSIDSAQNIGVTSELHLGLSNDINVGTLTVGGAKSVGLVDIVSGGTLTLDDGAGGSTDLYIGDNNVAATGTQPLLSKLDLTGGTFNATLGEVVIGRHATTGSGIGRGSLTMDAGSVTAASIQLAVDGGTNSALTTGTINQNGGTIAVSGAVTTGNGTSTVNVDNGTMTVGGDLKVDTLRVGYLPSGGSASRTGEVTVTGGGVVEIGSAANPTDLYLGYNQAGNSYNAVGTLDLTGAAQFDAYLGKLSLGEVTVGGGYNGRGQGILKLPALSNINAEEILISWSAGYGVNQPVSSIELGTTNNFNVDTFTVGGYRGYALVDFATTGTLTLAGLNSAEADLLISYCDPTNYPANSHMDMSGGTFDATLDQLIIGYDGSGPNNGGSVGKLTFSAGTITANSLTLGNAPSDGLGNGTLDMSGGSLTVNGNADLGTGTAVSTGTIDLSGGTLTVTGDMSGGAGTSTVSVAGVGTLAVDGTIDVNSLTLDGTGMIDAGTINVASGATFDFLGGILDVDTFNGNLLQQGGTLAPGNSPGTTTVNGDYTLGAAGTLEIEIEGLAPGTGYDQLIVNGEVDLAGDLSVLVSGYSTTPSDLFWILLNDGTDPISGQFAGIPENEPITIDGRTFYVYYGADFDSLAFTGGNDVLLTSVPEPSTFAMLLGLAGLGLLGYLRRRR